MIYAGRPHLLFWDKAKPSSSCDQNGQQTKYHICKVPPTIYQKVSGDSSCAAAGLEDYDGAADGCVAAARSTGYDFAKARDGGHKVPVIHDPEQTYTRTCVVCENMIYAGRPHLLFWDKAKPSSSCDQNGQQTKYHICKVPPPLTPALSRASSAGTPPAFATEASSPSSSSHSRLRR